MPAVQERPDSTYGYEDTKRFAKAADFYSGSAQDHRDHHGRDEDCDVGKGPSVMSAKSAWIIAALICGAAAAATVWVARSPLVATPFLVLFLAAGFVATVISHGNSK